jgi:replicative DNA helicase
MRLGKFYLRSAATGVGKTRTMVADFCNCGCSKIWKDGAWQDNGLAFPSFFISTELELEELQTMMVAFIADINEENILNNIMSFEERERAQQAIQIIKESPLYVEVLPDFSLKDIENSIKRSIRLYQVQYIFLDYIHTSMKILEEITRRSGGVKLREDNILFLLSVKLKEIATQFNVFILSSTQLNGDWKTEDIPDQNMLRGAKAIADKIDLGMILLDVTEEDKEHLMGILNEGAQKIPNVKLSVYKNRRGAYNKCYLWMYADKATCRFEGLFCTDYNYELQYIDRTIIPMRV